MAASVSHPSPIWSKRGDIVPAQRQIPFRTSGMFAMLLAL